MRAPARSPRRRSSPRALSDHGYELHLAGLHAPERRIANVRKLEQLAREFETARGARSARGSPRALVAGRVGSTHETEAPPPAAGTGAIRLMTIHAAKGLEFPVVCARRPRARGAATATPPLLTARGRVGLRLPTAERERVDTLDVRRAAQTSAARCRDAEEARISYVAMTRARERLIVSGAARFAAWPSATATRDRVARAGARARPRCRASSAAAGRPSSRAPASVPVRLTLADRGPHRRAARARRRRPPSRRPRPSR